MRQSVTHFGTQLRVPEDRTKSASITPTCDLNHDSILAVQSTTLCSTTADVLFVELVWIEDSEARCMVLGLSSKPLPQRKFAVPKRLAIRLQALLRGTSEYSTACMGSSSNCGGQIWQE